MTAAAATRALQSVLAAEHAVVYGYGVAGARLSGEQRDRAEAAYAEHRRVRDDLEALIRSRGAEPVAASAAYALPRPVTSPEDAAVLATLLEERLAAVWADAVATLAGPLRDRAVQGLGDAAVRAGRWRGGSVPFPGLPERSG